MLFKIASDIGIACIGLSGPVVVQANVEYIKLIAICIAQCAYVAIAAQIEPAARGRLHYSASEGARWVATSEYDHNTSGRNYGAGREGMAHRL